MVFKRYLTPERVIELEGSSRDDAFRELVQAICASNPQLDESRILEGIHNRENLISTRIATSIAIPHAQLPDAKDVVIAAGRSRRGIDYDKLSDENVHLIVMILGNDTTHLEVLSNVVAKLAEKKLYSQIVDAGSTDEIYHLLTGLDNRQPAASQTESDGMSRVLFEHMVEIADEIGADVVFVHLLSSKIPDFVLTTMEERRCVIVTNGVSELDTGEADYSPPFVDIPFHGLSRSSMVEMSFLFALAGGHFDGSDRAVSLLGGAESWDTILITDGESQLRRFFKTDLIEPDQNTERRVLAKTLQIAGALSAEGREGKPVGTIFVLGDCETVTRHCQQMVVNPFSGCDEDERNILDPGLEETIKEFAKIDGAFIIRGDGVIMSGGTFIKSSNISVELPKGLGSRHLAAASITAVTKAMAIVISESTRRISLFRNGRQLTLT